MKYGLGITSYKDENSKDKIPSQVVHTVLTGLGSNFATDFQDFTVTAAWGVYKGAKEPSAMVTFEGKIQPKHIVLIKSFLRKYNQESALLYSYESGSPAIEIPISKDIEIVQKEILEFTNGRFGEFITYIPSDKSAFILCVKDFGMNCEEFQKQALLVAHKFHGKLFKTKNVVIT